MLNINEFFKLHQEELKEFNSLTLDEKFKMLKERNSKKA